jgi:hypothetical protein
MARLEEIATCMISRWKAYLELGDLRAFTYSPPKFFAQGHWLNELGWQLDHRELQRRRLQQGAGLGAWRSA